MTFLSISIKAILILITIVFIAAFFVPKNEIIASASINACKKVIATLDDRPSQIEIIRADSFTDELIEAQALNWSNEKSHNSEIQAKYINMIYSQDMPMYKSITSIDYWSNSRKSAVCVYFADTYRNDLYFNALEADYKSYSRLDMMTPMIRLGYSDYDRVKLSYLDNLKYIVKLEFL